MSRFFRAAPWVLALMLGSHWCFAEGAELGAATPAQKAAAGTAYRRGLALFNEQKYDEALDAFKSSYGEVKSPNPRLMIGRTLGELKRYREANEELRATLAEAETAAKTDRKYEQTVQAVHAEIDSLEQKAARLTIETTESGIVSVDGAALSASELSEPVFVEPGSRNVVFVTDRGERVEQNVDAQAGQLTHVALSPPPKPAPMPTVAPRPQPAQQPDGRKTVAFVLGGVGVASIATFAVFAVKSGSTYSDLHSACSGQNCPSNKLALAETGKHQQTVANAALFVGIFALGTGSVLLWQSMSSPSSSESGVSLRVGAGSVSMDGQF